eukprot:Nk52_evm5s2356 gene=Nk52_evmTU5s2356
MEGFKCQGTDCSKEAKLQCPTCIKFNVPKVASFFCSQECFKDNWGKHKAVHKLAKSAQAFEASTAMQQQANMNMMADFNYTGKLRPYPLSAKRTVPDHIAKPDYADDGIPTSEMKQRGITEIVELTAEDIEKARKVSVLAREVLDIAASMIKPGVTTDEIDLAVHNACIERNSYPSPLNYHNFPKSCCTSVNEVICHGIPDMRPLEDGDIVNVDITLYHDGFHGDLNETFFVGTPSEADIKLVSVTYDSMVKAIEACKPGMRYRDIGNIISKIATKKGFSVVRSYCGHGIHRLFHTTPNVPHYAKNRAVGTMKPGHCFTIEPMISEGTCWDDTWPDKWTSVTRDGKRSAQFEQTFVVTETGVEVLSRRPGGDDSICGVPHFKDQLKKLGLENKY